MKKERGWKVVVVVWWSGGGVLVTRWRPMASAVEAQNWASGAPASREQKETKIEAEARRLRTRGGVEDGGGGDGLTPAQTQTHRECNPDT